jgi:hypothetical protein
MILFILSNYLGDERFANQRKLFKKIYLSIKQLSLYERHTTIKIKHY